MKKQVALINWLDDYGYGIFQQVDTQKFGLEFILARAAIQNNQLILYEELQQSKYMHRLMSRYHHELKTADIIMDIRETIKDLSISELESLLPSYYQLAIEARMKELRENATTKVKRKRKTKSATSD